MTTEQSRPSDPDPPGEDPLEGVLRRLDEEDLEPEGDAESGAADLVHRLHEEGPNPARYRLRSELGRGGMGEVLEVWDPHLRRRLAMKVALSSSPLGPTPGAPAQSADRLARFVEEAQITAQIDHPGVVPVHELGIDEEDRVYFTMAHAGGEDLSVVYDRVRAGEPGWTLARVVGLLERVCETVAYAHAKGVIHRDLKPANVRVGEFGEVYVLDWGIAKVVGKSLGNDSELVAPPEVVVSDRREETSRDPRSPLLTREGTAAGTPTFMSPEQARGEVDTLDARTDVYSVGAMLYSLLTGCSPYAELARRGGALQVLTAVVLGPPAPISSLAPEAPAELVAICEKAMAREPEDRYAGLREMAAELRAWHEGRVVAAYETGALAELRKWIGRNRIVAGVSLALALSLIIGTVVSTVLYLQSERRAHDLRRSRVSDFQTHLDRLIGEAVSLWPPVPELAPRLEEWIAEAERVPGDVAELRSQLEAHGAEPSTLAKLASVEEELRALTDPESGLLEGRSRTYGIGVRRRLVLAAEMEQRTIASERATRAWEEAIASISDPGECPRYRGLKLAPQLGLLPLGRNPESGLWEFAHVQSGELPHRDPGTGRLTIEGETGIVFVLVPGGRATIGAQAEDPDGENYDPHDRFEPRVEAPPESIELGAFFLAKYELTQGQWLNWTGANPSLHAPGTVVGESRFDLRHPVEVVSWDDGLEVLGWMGLTLPTEAQWEYAARAGEGTPWWTGLDPESSRGKINLADESLRRAAEAKARDVPPLDWPGFDDGWPYHAPVGTFPPNPYGLHEILGNVFELCRDTFTLSRDDRSTKADGERDAPDRTTKVVRGGAFNCPTGRCRASYRFPIEPDYVDSNVGFRAARRVDG